MEQKPPTKLTANIQALSERIKIAQQQKRKDLTVDLVLATAVLDEIVKLLAINAELHQAYLENMVVAVELDGGKF